MKTTKKLIIVLTLLAVFLCQPGHWAPAGAGCHLHHLVYSPEGRYTGQDWGEVRGELAVSG